MAILSYYSQFKQLFELIRLGNSFKDHIHILKGLIMYKIRRIMNNEEILMFSKFANSIRILDKYFQEIREINFLYELFTWGGIYESKAYISELLNPDNLFLIDIGSNVGRISFFFISQFPDRKVMLIDANPRNVKDSLIFAKNNFKAKIDNIDIINIGIADVVGRLTLYFRRDHDCNATFDRHLAERKGLFKIRKIPVTTLPKLLEVKKTPFHDVDLVKIDVEGFENKVLSGMRPLITNSGKFTIIAEIMPNNYSRFIKTLKKANADTKIEKLRGKNYKIIISP